MPTPTLVSYTETDWDSSATSKATASISWQAGDLIIAVTGEEGVVPRTLNTPTGTGLTFTSDAQIGGGGNNCNFRYHEATPSSSGSSAITFTQDTASTFGGAVWVYRNWTGTHPRTNLSSDTNASDNLTRAGIGSAVVLARFDFNAAAPTGSTTPSTNATTRQNAAHPSGAPHYTLDIADWGDQGAAGTTAYGLTTVPTSAWAGVLLEIQGLGGGGWTMPARPLRSRTRGRQRRWQTPWDAGAETTTAPPIIAAQPTIGRRIQRPKPPITAPAPAPGGKTQPIPPNPVERNRAAWLMFRRPAQHPVTGLGGISQPIPVRPPELPVRQRRWLRRPVDHPAPAPGAVSQPIPSYQPQLPRRAWLLFRRPAPRPVTGLGGSAAAVTPPAPIVQQPSRQKVWRRRLPSPPQPAPGAISQPLPALQVTRTRRQYFFRRQVEQPALPPGRSQPLPAPMASPRFWTRRRRTPATPVVLQGQRGVPPVTVNRRRSLRKSAPVAAATTPPVAVAAVLGPPPARPRRLPWPPRHPRVASNVPGPTTTPAGAVFAPNPAQWRNPFRRTQRGRSVIVPSGGKAQPIPALHSEPRKPPRWRPGGRSQPVPTGGIPQPLPALPAQFRRPPRMAQRGRSVVVPFKAPPAIPSQFRKPPPRPRSRPPAQSPPPAKAVPAIFGPPAYWLKRLLRWRPWLRGPAAVPPLPQQGLPIPPVLSSEVAVINTFGCEAKVINTLSSEAKRL